MEEDTVVKIIFKATWVLVLMNYLVILTKLLEKTKEIGLHEVHLAHLELLENLYLRFLAQECIQLITDH